VSGVALAVFSRGDDVGVRIACHWNRRQPRPVRPIYAVHARYSDGWFPDARLCRGARRRQFRRDADGQRLRPGRRVPHACVGRHGWGDARQGTHDGSDHPAQHGDGRFVGVLGVVAVSDSGNVVAQSGFVAYVGRGNRLVLCADGARRVCRESCGARARSCRLPYGRL
jgi:hypothetical protein